MIAVGLQKITDAVALIETANTNAKQAILDKGGVASGKITNLASDISTIPTSEDGVQYSKLISRTITEANSNVYSVGSHAFSNCTSLFAASFPLATSINDYAFSSCSALADVELPKCVTVSASAFSLCTSLRELFLPGCLYIYSKAFADCTNLKTVHIGSANGSNICRLFIADAFEGCRSLEHIYVPSNLVQAYKTATNWANYANLITGE